jgi:serine-type D-Ala-D-Ala carboxypeptidase (penicillin-binding protein 5/6)
MIRALLAVLLFLGLGHSARAQTEAFQTKAPQAILIDARSGDVLFSKDADTQVPPASMSKLMTMIMVFEGLKAGNLKLDQEFTVSEDAWRRGGASSGGSTMYAELKSRIKLTDLIQGVIVQSANDACIVIAEGMAGSETAFSEMMTAKARELGLKEASFKNATGLPDPDHRMSARDLAVMARYIVNTFPDQFKYYSQPEFTWNKITQQNRNPLLKDYPGADGMKTGYTKEAGYGLVGTASRDGRRLIMVIAGLTSIDERRQEAQKMLDWGFSQFRSFGVYAKNDRVGAARVWGGEARSVELLAGQDMTVALSPPEQKIVTVNMSYRGPLMAPVKAGEQVGMVKVMVNGVIIAESPILTGGDVAAVESMWSRALDSVMMMVFGG